MRFEDTPVSRLQQTGGAGGWSPLALTARRAEDRYPDEKDLANALDDLKPVRAQLIASCQLSQDRW